MSDEQYKRFKEAATPLIQYLAENCHPHVVAIITANEAELFEGQMIYKTNEFLKD